MKVLHYADCTTLSWGVPYIAHMKALAELGVEQTLLCRGGDELERLAKENGIPVRTDVYTVEQARAQLRELREKGVLAW